MSMIVLPTLQKNIRRAFFRLVLVFGALSLLLLLGIFLAVRVPSLLMRLNYDSISYAQTMEESFNAMLVSMLAERGRIRPLTSSISPELAEKFEQALQQASGNITEPTERQVVSGIVEAWQNFLHEPTPLRAEALHIAITALVQVNEHGMFQMLDDNSVFRDVLIGITALAFLVGIFWTFWLADGVVAPLSHPLRRAAEVFKQRPPLRQKLHLPAPQTLEVRILFDELSRLWSRLGELDALNVDSLLLEKHKLEVILESAEDAVLVLDSAGQVLHVSSRMVDLLTLKKEDILGQVWADLSTLSANYLALRAALHENAIGQGKQDIVLRVQGEEQVYSVRHRDLQGTDGNSASFLDSAGIGQVFLLSNVSETRQRESLRSEMMDWISHELKTPMQSLGLAADLLGKRTQYDASLRDDEELRMLVEIVCQDVARLRIVARQFMDVARMSPLALQLALKQVDLAQCLAGWLKPFQLTAREAGINLALQVQSPCPLVSLDTDRFAWVVSNLVSNAVRVCAKGATVEVRLYTTQEQGDDALSHEGALVLEVRDSGPGMPENLAKTMFQPYSHGRSAGSHEGLVGLGLAISHTIVEAHGAVISYERCEGLTIFKVELPLSV